MLELVKWYYNLDKFTDEEEKSLNTPRCNDIIYNDDNYKMLEKEYFDRMPFCNLNENEYHITFNDSGTSFINKIFEKEVDDDTLVITTTFEHPSVQDYSKNCKNIYLFKTTNEIKYCDIQQLVNLSKQYKKVFVYIIGTRLDTGEIIPQWYFQELKKAFIENNIEHKIMLDDVHGMFIVPRDYSIFDYILYTAHAIVKNYDMGLLISKSYDFGYKAYNWGKDYLERLDIILKRRSKLNNFKNIMTDYFNKLLTDEHLQLYTNTVGHIFSIKIIDLTFNDNDLNNLDEIYCIENSSNKFNGWLRWRFQEFIMLDEKTILEGIKYLEKIISKAILKNKLRG